MCIACKQSNDRTNPDPSFDTDLKLPADRLDPETVAVRVDVKNHHPGSAFSPSRQR
jgi:hypothetical protein